MKKIDLLMQELGFKKNAPDSVKEAFIKHLIKASTGVNVMTPSEQQEVRLNPQTVVALKAPEQMSFDFMESNPAPSSRKKAVS